MINRAAASPQSSQQVILQLQRQYGNRYVNRVLQQTRQLQTPIQAKLTLGAVGDKYEQEADRVAKQVVNQIQTPQLTSTTQTPSVQRDMMAQENKLQMKPADIIQREGVLDEENELGMNARLQRSATVDGGTITPDLETSIQQARGRGKPLPDNIRQPMEQAFGADFSGVKVHTDAQSDGLNQAVQAKAFTTGQDIFFRQGKYDPGSSIGQELLAHELTHVVQQMQGQIQSIQRAEDEDKGEKEKQTQELSNGELLQLIYTLIEDIEHPTNLEDTQAQELSDEQLLELIYTLIEDIEHPNNLEDTKAQEFSSKEVLKSIYTLNEDIEYLNNLEDTQTQEFSSEAVLESIYALIEDIEQFPTNQEEIQTQELRGEQLKDSSITKSSINTNHDRQKQSSNLLDNGKEQKELPEEVSDAIYHVSNTIGSAGSVLALDIDRLTSLGKGIGAERTLLLAPNIASNSIGIVGSLGTGLISGAFEAAAAHKALKEGRKAEAAAYGIQSGGDLASGALGIASSGLSLAGHAAATSVGSGASGAGAIFGTVEALRYGVGAHRSKKAKEKLEKIANSEIASPAIKEVARYAAKIQQKARTRQALYATGGALQMAGGVITAATGGTGIGAAVGIGIGLGGAAVKPVLKVTRLLKQKGRDYAANHQDTKFEKIFKFNKEKSTKNKDKEREEIANLLMKNYQDSDMQEILKNLPQVTKEEISQYQKGEMTQEALISILERREETLKLKVPNALKFSHKPKLSLANPPQ
ncbi:DUF4157 domain-containing protein [Scytonema sp. UIC 10036]|nr:DUF4157 domain-containing protein [Scytonema sp. UIC 10036]